MDIKCRGCSASYVGEQEASKKLNVRLCSQSVIAADRALFTQRFPNLVRVSGARFTIYDISIILKYTPVVYGRVVFRLHSVCAEEHCNSVRAGGTHTAT